MEEKKSAQLFGLDHLRALAITLVCFYHYQMGIFGHPTWLEDAAKFGWAGVDLFFVLSGYLISSQLFSQIKQGKTISLREFFLKRTLRILPAFWAVVAIYFLVPAFHERESLSPLWRFLTFTQNFGLDIKQHGTFSHSWSLCVEEHFYFLLPILLLCLQSTKLLKKAIWLIPTLFIFGILIRSFSWDHFYLPHIDERGAWLPWYKYIYYPTYNRLDGLLAGITIALLQQFLPAFWSKIIRYGNVFIGLSLMILTGAYFLCYHEHSYYATIFGFPLIAIGFGCLVIAALSPRCFLYRWKSRVTTTIATLSFALYLLHKGIIHVTQNLFEPWIDPEGNGMLIICIVTSVVAAWVLNLIVEKPFMRLRDRIVGRWRMERGSI
jgi:peptidoglycan/LPS O-acetylase OafA/YrhL